MLFWPNFLPQPQDQEGKHQTNNLHTTIGGIRFYMLQMMAPTKQPIGLESMGSCVTQRTSFTITTSKKNETRQKAQERWYLNQHNHR